MGNIALQRGDVAAACSWLEESVATFREVGDKSSFIGLALVHLGDTARHQGGYERAAALYEEGLALYREGGSKWGIALSLQNLGKIAIEQGDYGRAAEQFEESIRLYREVGNTPDVATCLVGFAGLASAEGQPERAARLLGAAQALLDRTSTIVEPANRIEFDQELAAVRTQLGEETFTAAWANGRTMTLEQAIAYALEDDAGASS